MNNSSVTLLGEGSQPETWARPDAATVRLSYAPGAPDEIVQLASQLSAALNRIAVLEESLAELQPTVWQTRQDTDALLLTVRRPRWEWPWKR